MAELATIARPYAEALFRAVSIERAAAVGAQLAQLAQVAADPALQRFADHPAAAPGSVYQLLILPTKMPLDDAVRHLVKTIVGNGRLAVLPEVAGQYQALVNERAGVSQATLYSAFPIDAAQQAEVLAALERRFGRKLTATVVVEPALIGGIRAVVGDEVLDTSVKARLEQMRAALAA